MYKTIVPKYRMDDIWGTEMSNIWATKPDMDHVKAKVPSNSNGHSVIGNICYYITRVQ